MIGIISVEYVLNYSKFLHGIRVVDHQIYISTIQEVFTFYFFRKSLLLGHVASGFILLLEGEISSEFPYS